MFLYGVSEYPQCIITRLFVNQAMFCEGTFKKNCERLTAYLYCSSGLFIMIIGMSFIQKKKQRNFEMHKKGNIIIDCNYFSIFLIYLYCKET